MKDIAIYFEKFNLGNDRFVFKPISVISGHYDKQDNQFVTDYGVICESIEGQEYDCDDYFGYQTTMKDLKRDFGEDNSESILLDYYFNTCLEYYYIGYYDYNNREIKVRKISSDDMEDMTQEIYISQDEQSGESCSFTFNLEGLKDLKDSKDLNEIREKIDNLIEISNNLKNNSGKLQKEEIYSESSTEKEEYKLITLKELRKEILSSIVGQDRAVNDITREIMINQTSSNPRNKSHILVTGPTGTGKTEIVKIISNVLDIPFFEADATAYTKEGYVGKSVYSMLAGLIDSANGDIEKAQSGILAIDEIDKKISSSTDDVSGVSVLQSLYKIMDRGIIELDIGMPGHRDTILFDTSNLTIILMGAFDSLYQNKLNEGKNQLGFNTSRIEIPKKEIVLTKDDLYKGGVPPEFLGRIGDITSTNFFVSKDLVRLLTHSNISALRLQQEYFKAAFNVDLRYTSGYTEEIANQAIKTKTNARELKPLVRNSLKYATEEFMDGRRGKVLKITKQTAMNPTKYEILR